MKDKLFYIAMAIFFLLVIFTIIFGEIRVQKRWDKYEQKVFTEAGIR